ncbi:MAG: cob(I)yrinic acid a,c-diamide adenosyltransferase [Candidatus Tectomicrobia bacterium]|nr:cob(I)yrinic acid a,c-diamide adenosyltransferase [Candidatus Tectomicrobia bacterium]
MAKEHQAAAWSDPAEKKKSKRHGLIIVNTGDGKGKTTAALGTAVRAVGAGMKVCIVQFIKGSWDYGELHAAEKLGIEIHPMGKGFTWEPKKFGEDQKAARAAWEMCKEKALSGAYDLVVFDEINYVLDYGFISVEEVVDFLRKKDPKLHLILTGRNAKEEIIEIADLVTEMREIKHPFQKGILAQKGIEY